MKLVCPSWATVETCWYNKDRPQTARQCFHIQHATGWWYLSGPGQVLKHFPALVSADGGITGYMYFTEPKHGSTHTSVTTHTASWDEISETGQCRLTQIISVNTETEEEQHAASRHQQASA